MRGRDLLLATLILLAGIAVTAYRRGAWREWRQTGASLLALCEPYGQAWANGEDWLEVESSSQVVSATGADSLTVDNPNGLVTINGSEQAQVTVQASRYGRGNSQQEAFPRAERASLGVIRRGGTVGVRVSGPEGFWRDGRIDLRITAPMSLGLRVRTASGPVAAASMLRRVEATTVSGKVAVAHAGAVSVTTATGDIDLSHVAGPVTARSVGGSVALRHASGDVDLATAGGGLELG
jgi:hypothetical protein